MVAFNPVLSVLLGCQLRFPQARLAGVEDARNLDVHAVQTAIVEDQYLVAALAFVVIGARGHWAYFSPVASEPLRDSRAAVVGM